MRPLRTHKHTRDKEFLNGTRFYSNKEGGGCCKNTGLKKLYFVKESILGVCKIFHVH